MSFELGLIGTGLGLGLRHGIDWDHIAAITDLTGTEGERRKAILLGTVYALGHALVVTVLGLMALWLGSTLPSSVDPVMDVLVGVTLVMLGLWLFYSLWRNGAEMRLRSRWMLLFAAVGWAVRKVGLRRRSGHEHKHAHRPAAGGGYGVSAAWGIGMLHGVGAETGTQVLLFAAVAGASSDLSGSVLLFAFVLGLVASNFLITVGSVLSIWGGRGSRVATVVVGVVAAVFSLVVGSLFLLGQGALLPELLA